MNEGSAAKPRPFAIVCNSCVAQGLKTMTTGFGLTAMPIRLIFQCHTCGAEWQAYPSKVKDTEP